MAGKNRLGRVREATKSIWNSFSSPRRSSSSPMGERHWVAGGAGTAMSCMAARELFQVLRGEPFHFQGSFQPGPVAHVLRALLPDTAERFNKKFEQFQLTCRCHPLELPNSIPCGCGWIATGHAITSWLTRSKVNDSSSSSTRKRAWGLTTEVYLSYSISFFWLTSCS